MKSHDAYSPELEDKLANISSYEREEQIEVMREWFLENYENPAERTPYDSGEGGYIFVYGGPFDAEEELMMEFEDKVETDVIAELARELDDESPEWTRSSKYDDYFLEAMLSNTEFHATFLNALVRVDTLLKQPIGNQEAQQTLYSLLYVNVITALETYLSDAFINTVTGDKSLVRKFVETEPAFKEQKFSLRELFEKFDTIEVKVKSHLLEIIWHNLEKVKPMYKATLNVDFPSNLKEVFKGIKKRHDIVHRNGKSIKGVVTPISKNDVENIVKEVKLLVEAIDDQLPKQ